MEQLLLAGSVVALVAAVAFLAIGIFTTIKAGKPKPVYTYIFFVASMLILTLLLFLWHVVHTRQSQEVNAATPQNLFPLWFSALGTTSLALMTFYLSVVKPTRAKPKLKIDFDNEQPYCRKDPPGQGQIYWLRVKVTNSGKSVAKTCVGRLVQFIDAEGKSIEVHDPVQLHWVGTPWMPGPEFFIPIDLQQGRRELLDVILTTPGSQPCLFMGSYETANMPRTDPIPIGVQTIRIGVYSENADPFFKEYAITWEGKEYTDIRLQ